MPSQNERRGMTCSYYPGEVFVFKSHWAAIDARTASNNNCTGIHTLVIIREYS